MSRLPAKGHPRYDVIYADRSARQIGALMVVFGLIGLSGVLGSKSADGFLLAVVLTLIMLGATFFTLGEVLRRRPTLGPVYGLVSLSGLCVGGCVLQVECTVFDLVPYAAFFTCPSLFAFPLTLPVLWHSSRAARAMRANPEQGRLGFDVLPLAPLRSRAEVPPSPTAPHRRDTSR
jgi:hypothetical protein